MAPSPPPIRSSSLLWQLLAPTIPHGSDPLSVPSTIVVRSPAGEEILDLEEFEDRMDSGEIEPNTEVWFPPLTGAEWMRAADIDAFRGRYEPRALYFSRAFRLGRIPTLTFAITLANLVVFLLMRRSGPIDTGALLDFGAKAGPLLHDLGESWRLLTANFVHRDWAHIGFNLFVLFHFGAAVENAYRPLDFLIIVVAAALGTTGLSYAMTDAASAGASGVGYGMLGGAVVFGLKYRRILPARYRSVLGGAVLPTVLVFLYIGWISSGVDNWGHVGGLVAGAAATSLFRPRLLGDPPAGRALVLRRVVPLVTVLAAVTLGGPLLQDLLPRMVAVRSERYGLELDLPASWHQRDELVFDNGMAPQGRATFSAGVRASAEGPDLEEAAAAFVERELRPVLRAGRIAELHLAPLRYVHVGGLLGVAQDLSFVADGSSMAVTVHLFARGSLLYNVVLARPERLEGYGRVFGRIVASVRTIDPDFLQEARSKAKAASAELRTWLALADAERQVGHTALARNALAHAEELAPGRWEVQARLASLSFLEGLDRQGCQLSALAGQAAPDEAFALVAMAECALSRGDREAAEGLLAAAAETSRTDSILRARIAGLRQPKAARSLTAP